MQAIVTKYHGPTDTRGSRFSASTESGHRISVPGDGLDAYENHERAAHALMKKLGWSGRIVGGGIKGGYAFVFVPGEGRDPGRDRGWFRQPRRHRAAAKAGWSHHKAKSRKSARGRRTR